MNFIRRTPRTRGRPQPRRPVFAKRQGQHRGFVRRSIVSVASLLMVGGLAALPYSFETPTASAQLTPTGTLVLYDNTGQWGFLGEQYSILTANLVSKFGTYSARPVSTYTAGTMNTFAQVVYVGSTYDELLPAAFLDDVLAGTKPVMWLYHNIWQLTARSAANGTFFSNAFGWDWSGFDPSPIGRVDFKSTSFTRYSANLSGIMGTVIFDPVKAQAIGTAYRADNTTLNWGVTTPSKKFTYVGEMPYAYMSENDRYVAFGSLLQDTFAPQLATQRRALVRIEDVGPDADPLALRAIADYLFSQGVPFSVATYSYFRNPLGIDNAGVAEQFRLRAAPDVVLALKYMQTKGGTILMHGWTHQLDSLINPYDAMSGNDFEFWRAHVDPSTNGVIYDSPVTGDSIASATARFTNATRDFSNVGLAKPGTIVFPHYAASAADYEAARRTYGRHYGRILYFSGLLTGGYAAANYTKPLIGQFFPYTGIKDVYGLNIVPENLGNVEPEPFNNHPARLPADIIATAQRNLVMKDATASFFFHPFLPLSDLQAIVVGVKGLGYTFVSSPSV
jgi:uncharacterized protein YdaL